MESLPNMLYNQKIMPEKQSAKEELIEAPTRIEPARVEEPTEALTDIVAELSAASAGGGRRTKTRSIPYLALSFGGQPLHGIGDRILAFGPFVGDANPTGVTGLEAESAEGAKETVVLGRLLLIDADRRLAVGMMNGHRRIGGAADVVAMRRRTS